MYIKPTRRGLEIKNKNENLWIRTPEEIELADLYGADAGFITEVPIESPRRLDSSTAAYLVSSVQTLSAVLVIMPENSDTAVKLIEK